MAKKDKEEKVLTPVVTVNNQVLKPLMPTESNTSTPMKAGECEVAHLKDGVETGETFICSIRMWERSYSLQPNIFKLKKK